jgi:L-iditol 2-dehydrogenase
MCVEGRYNLCENYGVMDLHRQYGHNYQGADAEYVVHGVKCVFPLPEQVSFEVGAVIDPASIALHVANRARVAPGDNVGIMGGGAIGLLSGDAARIRGAGRVIVVEPLAARRQKAQAMGFEVIDPAAQDPAMALREMTAGLGVDRVIEAAGVPATLRWALAALRKGGRIAAVGIPTKDVEINVRDLVLYELELAGCRASAGEMRRVMPHVADGRMRLGEVMTHEFALTDFANAMATFRDPASGAIKIIVKP